MSVIATLRLDEAACARATLAGAAAAANQLLQDLREPLRRRVAEAVDRLIRDSTEYQALLGGELQAQLGVVDPAPVVAAIGTAIRDGMRVDLRPVRIRGGQLEGGLTISLLREDLSEVLDVEGASYEETNKKGQTYVIPWLRWLLTAGDQVLIVDYRFFRGAFDFSRTGQGIMARGRTWSVPAPYSGVTDDNWLTRALLGMAPVFVEAVEEEIATRTA